MVTSWKGIVGYWKEDATGRLYLRKSMDYNHGCEVDLGYALEENGFFQAMLVWVLLVNGYRTRG